MHTRFWVRREFLDGACAHYVMVSKFQWKPFWLATQRDPQNDWTERQIRVNYDVFAQTHYGHHVCQTKVVLASPCGGPGGVPGRHSFSFSFVYCFFSRGAGLKRKILNENIEEA